MVSLSSIGKKISFLLAIASAAVVGGAATVLVSAAIPDNNGIIRGS